MTDQNEKSWWGPVWRGLIVDEKGKHIQQMGQAIWLFLYLIVHKDRETSMLVRKYETIAKDMGKTTKTIQRWMKQLEKFGYVQLRRLPHGFCIQVEKDRPLKKEKGADKKVQSEEERMDKSGKVIGHFEDSDRTFSDSVDKNVQSLSDNEIKVKQGREDKNVRSKDSFKDSIKENIYTIFLFWNDQNIIQHREIEKFKPCINARLKSYKPEEIIQAIKNYKDILESPDCFFSYRWTLDQFFSRKNGLDMFLDREIAIQNFSKRSNGKGSGNGADYEPSEAELREREEKIKRGREKYEKEIGVGA